MTTPESPSIPWRDSERVSPQVMHTAPHVIPRGGAKRAIQISRVPAFARSRSRHPSTGVEPQHGHNPRCGSNRKRGYGQTCGHPGKIDLQRSRHVQRSAGIGSGHITVRETRRPGLRSRLCHGARKSAMTARTCGGIAERSRCVEQQGETIAPDRVATMSFRGERRHARIDRLLHHACSSSRRGRERRGNDVLGLSQLRHASAANPHRMARCQRFQPRRGVGQIAWRDRAGSAPPALSRRRAASLSTCPAARTSPCLTSSVLSAAASASGTGPRDPSPPDSATICGGAARPSPASHSPASSPRTEPLIQIAAYTWMIQTMMAAMAARLWISKAIRCCSIVV